MAARRDAFKFIRWALDQHLRGARQSVLFVLAAHCDADGHAWPSRARLAAETGLSARTVVYALTSLEADGYIRRNGHHHIDGHHERLNVWSLSGAIQPPLLARDDVQPVHPVSPNTAQQVHPVSTERGAPQVRTGCKSTMGELPRTTKKTIRSRSPNGDLDLPPSGGGPKDLIEAFLAAPDRRKQVGALIDLGRAEGLELKGDRVAGIIRRYGRGQHVVNALLEAVGHRALEPHDYMEGVLRNGNRRVQEAGGRPPGGARSAAPRSGAGGPDIEAWERYAAGDG